MKNSGPAGSDPAEAMLGNNAQMIPTVGAFIFVNLDVDAVLDEDPIIMPFLFFFL